jgi:hypothetical protein
MRGGIYKKGGSVREGVITDGIWKKGRGWGRGGFTTDGMWKKGRGGWGVGGGREGKHWKILTD